MTKRLLFLRHAHADWNASEDRALSESGLAAASALCESLTGLEISRIYSSPYRRALQTVEPLAALLELEIEVVPVLAERALGDIGGLDFDEATKKTWREPTFAFPGGESNQAAFSRAYPLIRTVLDSHCTEGAVTVIASHGTLISLLIEEIARADGYQIWSSLRMPDALLLAKEGEVWRISRHHQT